MHELSIAESIVEMVEVAAERAGAQRVAVIHLRLGALSSVVNEALQFSFELVAAGTAAEGAQLAVEKVPTAIFCEPCGGEKVLSSPTFLCPSCGTPSADVRRGKELEVISIEVESD